MTNFTFRNADKTGTQLISELEEKIERYSRVPHYVLITGMRGTGKTTIARRLHEKGARAKKEFINLNCASLTAELLESELFGYEKGAFTGANAPKMGLFETANGGTLFLDEIGEIPLALQAKLLKAVEEKRIRRVGSNVERIVDTRIIAATSQNLEQMVLDGRFRADLFDRLNILRLETVPLKFQKEKIINLLTESLDKERQFTGRTKPFEISEEAAKILLSYEWHGNFRELHNFATRIAVECFEKEIISAEEVYQILGGEIGYSEDTMPETIEIIADNVTKYNFRVASENLITLTIDPSTDDLDSVYVKAAGILINHRLAENNNSIRQTAQSLGTAHSTICRLLAKFNAIGNVKQFPLAKAANEKFANAA
ncbi:MAG: sigma 54-interacting transcriptional regulator [Acidobacteriota bacterium]|nr:sigma 54-interacting transcriptional regulator [Acidobacteriota bacterium]